MIFVFKTSVKSKQQVKRLQSHFNNLLLDGKWNFDLDDCDKILRVESESDVVFQVVDFLTTNGFQCSELEN